MTTCVAQGGGPAAGHVRLLHVPDETPKEAGAQRSHAVLLSHLDVCWLVGWLAWCFKMSQDQFSLKLLVEQAFAQPRVARSFQTVLVDAGAASAASGSFSF